MTSSIAGAIGPSLKVHFHRKAGDEARRMKFPQSFEQLVSIITHIWGSASPRLCIEYLDDEGDRIRMTSDVEWEECVRQYAVQNSNRTPGAPLVLHVSRGQKPKAASAEGAPDGSSDDEGYNLQPAASGTSSSQWGSFIMPASVAAPALVPPQQQQPRVEAAAASTSAATQERPRETVAPNPPMPPAVIMAKLPPADRVPTVATAAAAAGPTYATSAASTPPTAPTPAAAGGKPRLHFPGFSSESEKHDLILLLCALASVPVESILLDPTKPIPQLIRTVVSRRSCDGSEVIVDVHRDALRDQCDKEIAARVRAADFIRGEMLVHRSLAVFPKEPNLHYNAACLYALSDRVHEALAELDGAVTFGFDNFNHALTDEDLKSIRTHPRFDDAIRKMKNAKGEKLVMQMMTMIPTLSVTDAKAYLAQAKGNLEQALNLAFDAKR